MSHKILRLLTNRAFVLILAFVAGLVFSNTASSAAVLTMPALAVVLAVSSTQVSVKDFFPLRTMVRPVLMAFLLNYCLLGGLILLLAWQLMPSRDLWVGYVLLAASPPGIAVIPFTYILKGNMKLSLLGTFGVYLLSVPLTPALVYLFTGDAGVSPLRLINTMIFLILLPFIVSQFLNTGKAVQYINKWRGPIINWGFFIVIFSVVGLNQEVFLRQHDVLIPVSIVALASFIAPALSMELMGKKLNIALPERNSYILLSSIKTSAFAAAVGINLFGEVASVPGAVVSAWYALYFIYLGFRGDKINAAQHIPEHITTIETL